MLHVAMKIIRGRQCKEIEHISPTQMILGVVGLPMLPQMVSVNSYPQNGDIFMVELEITLLHHGLNTADLLELV